MARNGNIVNNYIQTPLAFSANTSRAGKPDIRPMILSSKECIEQKNLYKFI